MLASLVGVVQVTTGVRLSIVKSAGGSNFGRTLLSITTISLITYAMP